MKPIIFSSEMVQATLNGAKTQTRRVIEPQPCAWVEKITFDKDSNMCLLHGHEMGMKSATHGFDGQPVILCPYKVGDKKQLYEDKMCSYKGSPKALVAFKVDDVFIEITDIRVERLQEINPYDLKLEGMYVNYLEMGNKPGCPHIAHNQFKTLWNSLNKKGFKWADDIWVWVISFKRSNNA